VRIDTEPDTSNTGLLVAAFGMTALGVVVLVVGALASWEPASLVVGVGLVVLGLLFAFVLGFAEARHAGKGIPRSIGRGFLTMFSWLAVLP
jgi:hypothetical protein